MLGIVLNHFSHPTIQLGLYIGLLICLILLYVYTIFKPNPKIAKTMITILGFVSMVLLSIVVVAETQGVGNVMSRFTEYIRQKNMTETTSITQGNDIPESEQQIKEQSEQPEQQIKEQQIKEQSEQPEQQIKEQSEQSEQQIKEQSEQQLL